MERVRSARVSADVEDFRVNESTGARTRGLGIATVLDRVS